MTVSDCPSQADTRAFFWLSTPQGLATTEILRAFCFEKVKETLGGRLWCCKGVALTPFTCYYGDPFCHPTIIILSLTFCCLFMSLLLGESIFVRDEEELVKTPAFTSHRKGLNQWVQDKWSSSARAQQDCCVADLEDPIQKVWVHLQVNTIALTVLTKSKLSE